MYTSCYLCFSKLLKCSRRLKVSSHRFGLRTLLKERIICQLLSNGGQGIVTTSSTSLSAADIKPAGDDINASKQGSLRIKSKRTSYYILDENLASAVASTVFKHAASKNSLLIEANPGPGVLTTAFFSAGFSQIVGLESTKEYSPYLQVLQCEAGDDHFQCYLFDLFTLWQRDLSPTVRDVKYRETETDIVNYLSSKILSPDVPVCVFGILPTNKEYHFLSYLVQQFLLHEGLFSVGQFHWYLFVSAKVYRELLTCHGDIQSVMFYNKLGIVLYNLFNFKVLMEVANQQFSPPFEGKKKNKFLNSPNFDINQRYLLQLTPKPDTEEIMPPHEVPKFMSFLKQLLFKKSARLIPRLEQLIPGCGIHLIKLRYTMTQSVVEMSPQQMMQLYKLMQVWPEYPDSPMHFYLSGRSEVGLEEDESHDISLSKPSGHEEKLT